MNSVQVAQAASNLDAWLETMRQPGGYGGPVAHWWQNRFEYAGVGLDWRYEGLLIGYVRLFERTGEARFQDCLRTAADDLLAGQLPDGRYRGSQFEMNPGTLGTPHEAAATLGLLSALPHLQDPSRALEAARRNLQNLIDQLWDGRGFNDQPGTPGRVPNKLATLAQALMTYGQASGDDRFAEHAQAALESVLHYQEPSGAVHQYAPGAGTGDGRFFPYYNARCVPPLFMGAQYFADVRFETAARSTLSWVRAQLQADGSFPQIVYAGGRTAEWPRWVAGAADVALAFLAADEDMPPALLRRLLAAQLPSGGFPTAVGFARQIRQGRVGPDPATDYRDALPVVGWNDKVLRLLGELLPDGTALPAPKVSPARVPVRVWGRPATFTDASGEMTLRAQGKALYVWHKQQPWAQVAPTLEVR